jgi:hypothetical protein
MATETADYSLETEDACFKKAREQVLQECCQPPAVLDAHCRYPPQSGFAYVVHIRTSGDANIIAETPSKKRIYKHLFLQNKSVKNEIVEYYRKLGFSWCDIVCLNRTEWRIFLWTRVSI